MIRGEGMPAQRHHNHGNLYVQFNVKFPDKNWTQDPTHFDALRAILPPATSGILPPDAMTEPADLADLDSHARSRAFGRDGGAVDDDDDGHPHGERVQCASQ